MADERLLVINPGSTSTKIAVYDGSTARFVESIQHSQDDLQGFSDIFDQFGYRRELVLKALEQHGIALNSLVAIASRGGLLAPVPAGAFEVNDDIVWQLRYRPQNEHPSNLGAVIAKSIADELGIKAYIYDPVTVDEMQPIARISGLPEFQRKSMGHPLNMRAAAHKYAKAIGRDYEELRLVIAHLGGGITLSAHDHGKMIDMVSDEEGPFSPQRTGGLPLFQTLEFASESGKSFKELYRYVKTSGGLRGHLGTDDAREVERRIEAGDESARAVYEAMAYGIAKHIGALATVLKGDVDAIILTGGVAYSEMMTTWIAERVSFIAPVEILPGENEMEALAFGVLRVLRNEEGVNVFHRVEDL